MTASIFLNDHQVELLLKARALQEQKAAALESACHATDSRVRADSLYLHQQLDKEAERMMIDFASSVLLYLPADFAE